MLWTALLAPPITWIDPPQESTGSEIVSREMDPVLFIHLLTPDNFLPRPCSTERWKLSRILRG